MPVNVIGGETVTNLESVTRRGVLVEVRCAGSREHGRYQNPAYPSPLADDSMLGHPGTVAKGRSLRMNGDLRGLASVRLIDSNREVLGIMTVAEALRAAMKAGLDLVETDPDSDPPTCKLIDCSRRRYEELKQQARARRPPIKEPE